MKASVNGGMPLWGKAYAASLSLFVARRTSGQTFSLYSTFNKMEVFPTYEPFTKIISSLSLPPVSLAFIIFTEPTIIWFIATS